VISKNTKHFKIIKNRFSKLFRWDHSSKDHRISPTERTINYTRRTINYTTTE